ncbi:Choline dehydrogenase mitochondrial [Zalerion maritima]|uniref:Choline dehydrogenase mitochondrial n=1 Tax=Zalerion maritima TaxID=339359 RepID=A0AAD5RIV7_9PEZI|nr:Choline dehydrogenase mitochondrial [Zalerion maritima]
MKSLATAIISLGAAILPLAPCQDEYDYVVIGSGPGGGPLAVNLAKAGYSVFVIEAGDERPSEGNWSYHVEVTGDESWSSENTMTIFQPIEHNNYLSAGNAGRGFNGFFQTYMATSQDQTESIYGLVTHAYSDGDRYRSRDYIQSGVQGGFNLTVSLNSLALRVLLDTESACGGERPRATGVEYLEGKSIYEADRRRTESSAGTKKAVTARREIIVSGGVFNSPQILMLSGIGNCTHPEDVGVECLHDLPGVGQHLMDNQEMPIVGSGSAGFGSAGVSMIKTKHPAYGDRDMILMGGPGFLFRGFWPSNPIYQSQDPASVYGVSVVKGASVNSGGWVKLKSNDRTETPEINFNHFAVGSEYNLEAMKDTVAWARTIYNKVGITPTEPPCSCGEEDEAWIRKQTFGHHPTSTCRIGADDYAMVVLDSKFRVRGVDGLGMVDASAFARIPGVFPAVSTFTISQKASDDMLAEIEAGEAIEECSATA